MLFHCAPQDIDKDVRAMYEIFGERKACAVREITKIHEESQSFLLSEGLQGEKRGEYILVVEGAKQKENPLNTLSETEHIKYYIEQGFDKKEALKKTAKDRGVSKSDLYKFSIDL
jgi:16S rRNA (cytidine1402-2'-O)-methyltransferase